MTAKEIAEVIRGETASLLDHRMALLACARMLVENWQHPHACYNATGKCSCQIGEIVEALK